MRSSDSRAGLVPQSPPAARQAPREHGESDSAALQPTRPTVTLSISPKLALLVFVTVTTLLTLTSVGVDLLHNRSDVGAVGRLVKLLSLNGEANIPAWYSTCLWLTSALLAGAIATFRRSVAGPFVAHWVGFAIVCAYLSLDEAAMIHENAGNMIRKTFAPWKFLRIDDGWVYSWMYYGVGFVAGFLVFYRRFLCHLPRRVRRLMIGSGFVYLSGALGMESLSAAADHEKISIASADIWVLMIGAEEYLEMLGVVLLIYTLLTYMRMARVCVGIEAAKRPLRTI